MAKPNPFVELYRPHRVKAFYGGRGSGKSWAVARALVTLSNLASLRVLCCREIQNSIRESSYQLLKDTVISLGLESKFTFLEAEIRHENGSKFTFKGLAANEQSVKSTEGVDVCWVEEAQSVSQKSWDVLMPTIRKEGSEIWATFNPLHEDDPTCSMFLRDDLPAGWYVRKVNYDENPHFPDSLREQMEWDRKNDFEKYLHVWEGFPRTISDAQVLKGRYVVEDFPPECAEQAERLFFGADFGFAQDPNTLVRCFIRDRRLYVDYEAYGVGVEIAEMGQFYRSVPLADKWPIKCDAARPETISHLRNVLGFNASPAKKWQGSVEDGIAYLRGFEKIVIHPRCKHMAEEARLYSYKLDRRTGEVLPVLEDKHNHCMDALRYALDGYITKKGTERWARFGGA